MLENSVEGRQVAPFVIPVAVRTKDDQLHRSRLRWQDRQQVALNCGKPIDLVRMIDLIGKPADRNMLDPERG